MFRDNIQVMQRAIEYVNRYRLYWGAVMDIQTKLAVICFIIAGALLVSQAIVAGLIIAHVRAVGSKSTSKVSLGPVYLSALFAIAGTILL